MLHIYRNDMPVPHIADSRHGFGDNIDIDIIQWNAVLHILCYQAHGSFGIGLQKAVQILRDFLFVFPSAHSGGSTALTFLCSGLNGAVQEPVKPRTPVIRHRLHHTGSDQFIMLQHDIPDLLLRAVGHQRTEQLEEPPRIFRKYAIVTELQRRAEKIDIVPDILIHLCPGAFIRSSAGADCSLIDGYISQPSIH